MLQLEKGDRFNYLRNLKYDKPIASNLHLKSLGDR